MHLYVYEGYKDGRKGRQRSEDLIRKAAALYIQEQELEINIGSSRILRRKRGKPFFETLALEFSVSHTKDLWVCAMDLEPMGVDIQEIRTSKQEKIMNRYYTQEEKQYVKEAGQVGFFQIWTRKEAYVKFLGTGLSKDLRDFSTLTSREVDFIDFDIRQGIKGSCCAQGKKELWIRRILQDNLAGPGL
jgi:4'-phosphopantetheinyl transferase